MSEEFFKDDMKIDNVSVSDIALTYGTPCFLYSEETIIENFNAISNSFCSEKRHLYYAVKANSNLSILNCLNNLGAGFDIVSLGELHRVAKINSNTNKIVYSGVGKTRDEIIESLNLNIRCINVESIEELFRIERISNELGVRAPIAIRINPNIDTDTHSYVATGHEDSKFGISREDMNDVFSYAIESNNLNLIGIHYHIGSQILSVEPFILAIEFIANVYNEVTSMGANIELINMGGGLGINYTNENPPELDFFGKSIVAAIEKNKMQNLDFILELGRSIVGNAGYLLTQVEYVKKTKTKNFVVVNAGMDNLIRPALYQSIHEISNIKSGNTGEKILCDIVGPVCECSDFFLKDIEINVEQGDILVIKSCGAYASSMSSNYNSRRRAAEVLIRKGKHIKIRDRDSLEDLYDKEILI